MKEELLDILICPSCLPGEHKLKTEVREKKSSDILKGRLFCKNCGRVYPILEGTAFLEPGHNSAVRANGKYGKPSTISSYLWSHYGDLLHDPEATNAYREWARLIKPNAGLCLDIGSAVGRFSLEMTRKASFVIGVDSSSSFIQIARKLMVAGQVKVTLAEEGLLTCEETIQLPKQWDTSKVEFIVADCQALPFRAGIFSAQASLNLIDKISKPMIHLKEVNRLAKQEEAQFLLSDPFSWSTDAANEKDWLGGKEKGPYSGRGMDNIMDLLRGQGEHIFPQWNIHELGHVWWKIRNHCNHYELIRSCFVKATR